MWRFRALMRLVSVAVLLAGLAGCRGFEIDSDVFYAPGYGYVVEVERYQPKAGSSTFETDVNYYFYVFETEEEARRFIEIVKSDPTAKIASDHQPRYAEYSDEFDEIDELRRPLPVSPGKIDDAIERVTPPVPTAPAPL